MSLDLRAFEEECDLGVGRVGEHVEDAALDGAQRGHCRKVCGQRCGVARGVDDAGRVALVQVGGQVSPDASTRRGSTPWGAAVKRLSR